MRNPQNIAEVFDQWCLFNLTFKHDGCHGGEIFLRNLCLTEMKKFLCTWLGEVCYSCSLTVLPGPAWVVLNYVLQRIFFTPVNAPADELEMVVE